VKRIPGFFEATPLQQPREVAVRRRRIARSVSGEGERECLKKKKDQRRVQRERRRKVVGNSIKGGRRHLHLPFGQFVKDSLWRVGSRTKGDAEEKRFRERLFHIKEEEITKIRLERLEKG